MKALILKDIFNLKSQSKMLFLGTIAFVIIGITRNDSLFTISFLSLYCAILPITAMSYDERSNFNTLALTMPISKKDIVISKYILGLIFCFIGAIISIGISFITLEIVDIKIILSFSLMLFIIPMLYLSIIIPLMFYLGTEKGRLLMMLLFLIPTWLFPLFSNSSVIINTIISIQYIIPFAVIVLYLISIFISIAIFNKKEL